MKFLIFVFCILSASAESLRYSINWPSGLSLGEASLDTTRARNQGAAKGPEKWSFSLDIDASVPGFAVRDHYDSSAGPDLCSLQFDKKFLHGSHKTEERITFDQEKSTATRETQGGGKSDISLSGCGRDALTFLQFARNELAQGRLAPQQQVVFGSVYSVRLEFTGLQTIKVAEQNVEADRILATIRGPSSNLTVELFFARDNARTPLLAKVPLALGTFSVELVR
ncbi:MAG TPA: DUF3108 domain-containing protein [Bryobacteraceae bacterium]|nr:DUF3108 domain-containing protein [Bryobacteraceae bacterium]